jgi:hypothetical protein
MKVISVVIISILSIFLSAGALVLVLWHDRMMRDKDVAQMINKVNVPVPDLSTIPELEEAVMNLSTAPPTTVPPKTVKRPI